MSTTNYTGPRLYFVGDEGRGGDLHYTIRRGEDLTLTSKGVGVNGTGIEDAKVIPAELLANLNPVEIQVHLEAGHFITDDDLAEIRDEIRKTGKVLYRQALKRARTTGDLSPAETISAINSAIQTGLGR